MIVAAASRKWRPPPHARGCDVAIAAGVIAASKQVGLKVPLVVRLEGTNVG